MGVRAESFVVDVADETSVGDAMAATVESFGKVDTLIANAGVTGGGPFVDQTLAQWRAVMSVNLDGVFLCFRAAARHLVDRGEGGSLVAVSSTSAIHGAVGQRGVRRVEGARCCRWSAAWRSSWPVTASGSTA